MNQVQLVIFYSEQPLRQLDQNFSIPTLNMNNNIIQLIKNII